MMLSERRDATQEAAIRDRVRRGSVIVLSLFVLAASPCCPRQSPVPQAASPARPSAPNLAYCTRLEIQYEPSTLAALFRPARDHGLLSEEEARYLESLKKIMVSDQDRIKALSDKLSLGEYVDGGMTLWRETAYVIGYRDTEQLVAFDVKGPSVVTEDGRCFCCRKAGLDIAQFTPEVWPYVLRSRCRDCLEILAIHLPGLARDFWEYADPTEWCDAIVRNTGNGPEVEELFKCPSAGEGRCHYAMNPNCRRSSPADMVLLFETKAGWNQYGGPNLFTFDNHTARGGLVVLINGTARFIRTEEELKQLRWE